jgi:RNA polymerase sigma-70 factor, ECF subfamily
LNKAFRSPNANAPSPVQSLACEARAFVVSGHEDAARAAYDELVGVLQRRACRIAFHYLRDLDDADEAVQDAFVKAYVNLASYKEHLPFDAWFVRILVNGCLDRLKRRRRQLRWSSPLDGGAGGEGRFEPVSPEPSVEETIAARECQLSLGEAINRLPDRQRTVVLLTHLDGRTPREVSVITGLNENTVRVHLFRAIRRLRTWLVPAPVEGERREMEA